MQQKLNAARSTDEILEILQRELPELARRYGVKSLGLFGSYLHGQQTIDSDLDLLVEFDNPHLTLLQFVELQLYLSDLLDVRVDLVEKETLKPAIGRRILGEVVTL
jgi:uncharacterized protein